MGRWVQLDHWCHLAVLWDIISIILLLWEICVKQHQTANGCKTHMFSLYIFITYRYMCKIYIYIAEANIICTFQTSHLSRFFGSYLRVLVRGVAEKSYRPHFQCQPWCQDLLYRHWYGDWLVFGHQKLLPQLRVCWWYHVVSNSLNCSATEMETTCVAICISRICCGDIV